jgi:hypothetical protein
MMDTLLGTAPPLALLLIGVVRRLHRGISLADEGYLIYGTLALMRGEVPIRDFRAYDPGRYLWCALFFRLFGPGFVTGRIAMATLSGISTVIIVQLTLRASDAPLLAAVTGCLSVLWMQSIYKQGELLFSVLGVTAIVALDTDSGSGLLVAGLMALGVIYGHNILIYMTGAVVLYGVAQFATEGLDTAWMADLLFWLAVDLGLILGVSALVPGYLSSFWSQKILVVLRRGTTNLPLAKPWLWSGQVPHLSILSPARQWAFKALFTALPCLCGLAMLVWHGSPDIRTHPAGPVLVGSAVTGLAYLHHLWSRADLPHLHHVMLPFVLLVASMATLALPGNAALALMLALCAATVVFLRGMPEFALSWGRHGAEKVFETAHDRLLLDPPLADHLNRLKAVIEQHSNPADPIFVAPLNIAIVAATDRRSAAYDCFPVYPATDAAQTRMIRELKRTRPKLAIIGRQTVDGRADLLFEKNYARVNRHILNNYELVLRSAQDSVYLRRERRPDEPAEALI